MPRVLVTEENIIISSQDGKSQTFIRIDEESEAYLAIKEETNNFTKNMDFPKTEVEILQEQLATANNQIDSLTMQLGDALLTSITQEEYNNLIQTNTSLVAQVEQLTIQLGDLILNGGA